MEHKPRMPKMELDAAEGAQGLMKRSPEQQQAASQILYAALVKGESPAAGYEAFPNCQAFDVSGTTVETESQTPAEPRELVKWQKRKSQHPGRDHRRYYQERWKMEYLMDYDCLRHGLVCMVCGSALATLKLSTIKRHILQKHQDTMLLSHAEKEVVIATWVEHLLSHSHQQEKSDTLEAEPRTMQIGPAPGIPPAPDPGPAEAAPGGGSPPRPEPGKAALSRRPVRRYYQERWRTEYLMDYDGVRHGLVCMVCGSGLATLKLSTIKRHILQRHQASLGLTARQRRVVMATWMDRRLHQSQPAVSGAGHHWRRPLRCDQLAIVEPVPAVSHQSGLELQGERLPVISHGGQSPRGRGACTLIFDQSAPERRAPVTDGGVDQSGVDLARQVQGNVTRHTREVAAEWHKHHQSESSVRQSGAEPETYTGTTARLDPLQVGCAVEVMGFPVSLDQPQLPADNDRVVEQQMPQHSALNTLPGKGTRRYYQERWRFEHLMDYDWWRHGLVCMVCGKSLATLTLSTIKRHILQNHPHSLHFNQAERENILEAWNERALQRDCTAVQLVMPGMGPNWSAGKRPRCHYQEHWRYEYLMDYDHLWHTLVCMVCGKLLATVTLSTIKQHILQNHPHSLSFNQGERENVLEAWNKTISQPESAMIESQEEESSSLRIQAAITEENPVVEFAKDVAPGWDGERVGDRSPVEIEVCVEEPELGLPTRTVRGRGRGRGLGRGRGRGRDHWRNYQDRWRLEYLMDYDQWRHGLVCMVCGSALATLKLSTIKRHILQKHQDTMDYTLAEKVMVVDEWNKKITTVAKMDFWQLSTSRNGSLPRQPGGMISAQR
ncbi:zinc finger translocation-associated protein [Rhincodon typus]|uniref:zinc finger translocation-associated protein n=1 Tax=Rhincodon typus TaxID=259920 RepID=UPI0009A39B47|nr:zinc finger translocation-associated protein [Rhincodon typus]